MKNRVVVIIICVIIFILGLVVYFNFIKSSNVISESVEATEMNLDYLRGDDHKLVTIFENLNCYAVELILYDDNTYELVMGPNNIKKGTYDFNVISLFGMMSAQKVTKENESASWRVYTLTTGKGEEYIANDNSIPIKTLLEQLDINLYDCQRFDIQD